MARIRSIHPGLFTDEAFVALSSDAQVFLLGLWTEADDQGLFEWKPITLRMRLRPTKDGGVDGLLAEMVAVNAVRQFESGGRHYGAIRNFRKFQRPKSPNAIHPLPPEIRIYVGLGDAVPEIPLDEPPSFPPKGEIAPQMEDVGCRRKEISSEEPTGSSGASAAQFEVIHGGKGPDGDKPDWWPKCDRYGRVLGEITDKLLFDVGKAVLGVSSGGQITRLKKCTKYRRDWRAAMDLLLRADGTSDPSAWFAKALKNAENDEPELAMHEVYPESEYRL